MENKMRPHKQFQWSIGARKFCAFVIIMTFGASVYVRVKNSIRFPLGPPPPLLQGNAADALHQQQGGWVIARINAAIEHSSYSSTPPSNTYCNLLRDRFPNWTILLYPVTLSNTSRKVISNCIFFDKKEAELGFEFYLQNSAFLYAIKNGAELIYAVNLTKSHLHALSENFAYHVSTKANEYLLSKCAGCQISSNHCGSLFTFVKSKYPLIQIQLPSIDCAPGPQKFVVDTNLLPASFTITNGIYLHKDIFWALGNSLDFQFILHSLKLLNAHILIARTNTTGLMNRTIQVTHNDESECAYFWNQLHSNTSIHQNWFRALKKGNYEFPPIAYTLFSSLQHKLNYSLVNTAKLLTRTCGKLHPTINLINPWIIFSDIALVIVFNNPFYEVIPFVDSLYRPFFPNIVYCGPEALKTDHHVKFIRYKSTPRGHEAGSFNYECVSLVENLNLSVKGYLFAADDLSFSPYKILKFNRSTQWFIRRKSTAIGNMTNLFACNLDNCTFSKSSWIWWKKYKVKVLTTLEGLERKTDIVSKQCHTQLVRLTGCRSCALGGFSDIYYIPTSYISNFQSISKLFLKNQIFLGIAVPTILYCLAKNDIEEFDGIVFPSFKYPVEKIWKEERMFAKMFVHRLKWSKLLAQKNSSTADNLAEKLYCRIVLPWIHDRCGHVPEGPL